MVFIHRREGSNQKLWPLGFSRGGRRGTLGIDNAGGGSRGGRPFGVLASATADGDVAESAASGPVAAAVFAEVTGLGEVVVVEVAEFGIC